MKSEPGKPKAVYVGGVKYRSMFAAAVETGISARWLSVAVAKSGGAPSVVKKMLVVTHAWVESRAGGEGGRE